MKVSELIKKLSMMDKNAQIFIEDDYEGLTGVLESDVAEVVCGYSAQAKRFKDFGFSNDDIVVIIHL